MKENIFTCKLLDVIIPSKDQENFNAVVLVLDFVIQDLRMLMDSNKFKFEEDHAIIILYNILCGINFLHSANIMHRDLKPGNILINYNCEISICDFGMATTIESVQKTGRSRS